MTVSMHIDRADPHLHGWCLAQSGSVVLEINGKPLGRFLLSPTRADVVNAFDFPSDNVGFDLVGGAALLALKSTYPELVIRFKESVTGDELMVLESNDTIWPSPLNHFSSSGERGCAGLRWAGLEWLDGKVVFKGTCNNPEIAEIKVYELDSTILSLRGKAKVAESDVSGGSAHSFSLGVSPPKGSLLFILMAKTGVIIGIDWIFAGYLLSKDYTDHAGFIAGGQIPWADFVQQASIAERSAFLRLAGRERPLALMWDEETAKRLPPMYEPLVKADTEGGHEICDTLCGVLWGEVLETLAGLREPARVQLRKVIHDELTARSYVIEPPMVFPQELSAYARCSTEPCAIEGDPAKPLVTLAATTRTHHRITRLNKQPNSASKGVVLGTLLGGSAPLAEGWSVSVAVSFRDRARMTCDFLLSLMTQKGRGFLEILLVDNQSSPLERAAVEAFLGDLLTGPDAEPNVAVKIIDYPYPFNHSAQTNLAVAAATNEFVLLANNDIIIPDDRVIASLVPLLTSGSVATASCILMTDKAATPGSKKFMSAGMFLRKSFDPLCEPPLHEDRLPAAAYPEAILTHGNTFGFSLVRKSIYQAVGALDEEQYPADYNDVDFCLRASEAGYYHLTSLSRYVYHVSRASRGGGITPPFVAARQPNFRKLAAQGFRFWKK